jgi:uncharacterized membrane protein YfhO
MDPLAEKILEIKRKKEEAEQKRQLELKKATKRKQLLLDNRLNEFSKLVQYLKSRINTINSDLDSKEMEYIDGDREIKIVYGEYYLNFHFDYIYSKEPEGTQIIVTIGKNIPISTDLPAVMEEYYWIPRVPDEEIRWTQCNNYHIEGDIKDVTIEEAAGYSLEKFVCMQLK